MTYNTHEHCQTTNVYLPVDESVTEAKAALAFASVTDIDNLYYAYFDNDNMMLALTTAQSRKRACKYDATI